MMRRLLRFLTKWLYRAAEWCSKTENALGHRESARRILRWVGEGTMEPGHWMVNTARNTLAAPFRDLARDPSGALDGAYSTRSGR